MMKYACRAIAGIGLIGAAVSITAIIGMQSRGATVTWSDAWTTIAVLASAMALGWLAGRESKESE